ncbi:hypothetical protein AVEN_244770-1 [Araneus ventricosus]|uniref:Uncharacterized protein n=1 Tax=Araneus ventricosus TaxID=182803 RepID=A0A4Y2BS61_ARAVE|nr:hypothetical protein AVEN_244770-1 [Araneus ventricosus]
MKSLLQKEFIIRWQTEWDNGETGSSVNNVLLKAKMTPYPWQRPEIIFVTAKTHSQHSLNDSTSETVIPVAADTWEILYTVLQAACVLPHTT